jgi:hypothetical protein
LPLLFPRRHDVSLNVRFLRGNPEMLS